MVAATGFAWLLLAQTPGVAQVLGGLGVLLGVGLVRRGEAAAANGVQSASVLSDQEDVAVDDQ